jgi:hypothetical protein
MLFPVIVTDLVTRHDDVILYEDRDAAVRYVTSMLGRPGVVVEASTWFDGQVTVAGRAPDTLDADPFGFDPDRTTRHWAPGGPFEFED